LPHFYRAVSTAPFPLRHFHCAISTMPFLPLRFHRAVSTAPFLPRFHTAPFIPRLFTAPQRHLSRAISTAPFLPRLSTAPRVPRPASRARAESIKPHKVCFPRQLVYHFSYQVYPVNARARNQGPSTTAYPISLRQLTQSNKYCFNGFDEVSLSYVNEAL
jgi:hypothetical protein